MRSRRSLWLLPIVLSFGMAACQPIQRPAANEDAAQAEAVTPKDEVVIEVNDTGISGPESVPAGLTKVTIRNTGAEGHSAIVRRLNDDVPFAEWEKVVAENPMATFPMTFLLGGPDLEPETEMDVLYQLEPGFYIAVDNWVDPHRYTTFDVIASDAPADQPPEAAVTVSMSEYAFDAPESIAAGSSLWQVENAGEAPHQMAILRLEEGKTPDEVAAWWDTQEGPPPFTAVAWWNTMSPGATSWFTLSLEPGEYYLYDFLPDLAHDGAAYFTEGMVKKLVVE